jgi:hypothetical protein
METSFNGFSSITTSSRFPCSILTFFMRSAIASQVNFGLISGPTSPMVLPWNSSRWASQCVATSPSPTETPSTDCRLMYSSARMFVLACFNRALVLGPDPGQAGLLLWPREPG